MHLSCGRLLLASLCAVVVSGSPTRRQSKRSQSYSMPLNRDPLYGFLGNISLGTPAQQVTAFVDWTWISMYVLSTVCDGDADDTASCLSPDQPIFNQTLSSSYQNESSLYPSRAWNPNEFFGTFDFRVDYASDIETVGPSSSRIIIQASDFQPDIFTTTMFPFTGIYGLAPVLPSDNASTQSPFYQMWKNGVYPAPFAGFIYCYKDKTLCDGYDAVQTLGGYDEDIAGDGLTWYPVVEVPEVNVVDFHFSPGIFNYWALRVTQLSLGNEVQALNKSIGAAAIFDNASKGRGAPLSANAYQEVVAMSNATAVTLPFPLNNGAQAFYQIECSKINTLPPIKYQFGGDRKIWEIIPANYVDEVSPNVCVLNIRTIGEGDFSFGNLGETFMKDKYIVFDFKKNRVGIADVCN